MPQKARQALEMGDLASHEESLRLDMKLGDLRDNADHTGAACLTVDCILSPTVLKEAESDRCPASLSQEEHLSQLGTSVHHKKSSLTSATEA